ncbi:MAG: tandem-95 repeat protein, partial [Chthoniobacterales bacterium]|nr:tandem-95 repeat protein [Chthoniobacterales bacterium]
FGANELLSVGMAPASGGVGGNTALLVTDASGQKNLDLGAEIRGAIIDVRIDFDTKAGTYICAAKFRADATYKTTLGTLKLSGASVSMTALGYINGNNPGTGNHHMILDGLQIVSAASAGGGTSPAAVTGSLGGLVANTTYHYRAMAQNSIGQTAGADAVFYTGANAAPTIGNIPDQSINQDTATGAIAFTVGDIETAAGSLTVTGSSSNTSLVPNTNISFGGSEANRTVTITPATGKTGTAIITVFVGDGTLTASDTFVLTVNAPPTVTGISALTINENAGTGALAFTVGDAETATGSLAVTATSSNQMLVPDANIVIGGSGTNRTVTVTPAGNANGTATITINVSDGNAMTSTRFLLTVNAVNDPPTISNIANQTITAGTATPAIKFSVDDVDTPVASLVVTASSSNQALVPDANISISGSGAYSSVTITPLAGQNGTTTITLTVSDGELSTSSNFVLTVNAPPTISAIADQTTDEDTAIGAIAFMVGDTETAVTGLTVSATSSNAAVVPDANIAIGGGGSDRTVTVTPAANANGTAMITVTVSDGQAAAVSSFNLTVNAVNDPPTISAIGNQGIAMNTSTAAIAFTISDVETAAASLTVTGSSDNHTLVPDANLVFEGSGANRTVTVTPATGQTGTAKVAVNVSDGSATTSTSFILTVTQGNQVPTISDIADRTVFVNSNTGAIGFTVSDADTEASSLTLTGSSDNHTLVPKANIVFVGSDASRTVTVTPAANQTGSATITVTVSDGTLTTSDTFVITVNQPPDITIEQSRGSDSAINSVYTNGFIGLNGGYGYGSWSGIATGSGWNYLDTATNGLKSFAIYSGGGSGNGYTASRSFSTPMAVGETFSVQLGYTTVNSGGEVGIKLYSGGALRLTLRLAPSTSTSWQLNDGGSFFGNSISQASGTPLYVVFTRNSGNGYNIKLTSGAQVLSGTNWTSTSGTMSIDRVDFYSTAQGPGQNFRFANLERFVPALAAGTPVFDFGTVRVAAPGSTLTYVVRNDGAGPLSGLALAKSGSNGADFDLGSLGATTLATGEKTTFQVTLNPAGQGARSASASLASNDPDENPFTVNFAGTGLNDAPAISNIPDQTVSENTGTGPIAFIVGDVETPGALVVTAVSSDKMLIPDGNITLLGSGSDHTIAVTPAANQNGTATITVTVSDGDRTVTDAFTVTVSPVNGLPIIGFIADQITDESVASSAIEFTVGDAETAADQLVVTAASDNQILVPNENIELGGSGASRTVTVTPAYVQSGDANITLTVSDGAASASTSFKLTVRAAGGFDTWSVLQSLPADRRGPTDRNGPLAVANLAAYAMGLNPLTAAPADLPSASKGSNNMSITFRRSRFATDVKFNVEAANTMTSSWTNIWTSTTNAYTGGTNDFETVIVTDPQPMDQAPAGQRYLRLKVMRP